MSEAPAIDLAVLRRLNDGGYGFYRDISRVRADDLFVRSQVADALHRAAATLCAAERAARAALPAPSREHPFPDAAALAAVRAMHGLTERIAGLETRLRGAAALPDRDFSRLVPSDTIRQALVALDASLLASAESVEKNPCVAEVAALEAAIAAREALGK